MRSSGGAEPDGRSLETAVIVHVAILVILSSWAFGGNIGWARTAIVAWGAIGVALAAALARRALSGRRVAVGLPLTALALFNALALAGLLNPVFRQLHLGNEVFYLPIPSSSLLPSSAGADVTVPSLAIIDVIYLSCFNILLGIRRRHSIRLLLSIATVNALVLAIFGTVQKLAGSSGLFFGAVRSPQDSFFASFIYHNHWGAFAVLMTAAGGALAGHYASARTYRDAWHSPAPFALVAVFLVAASIPLSTSRSCTILVVLLLAYVFVRWISRLIRRRRMTHSPIAGPVVASCVLAITAAFIAFKIGEPVIRQRIAKTSEQVAEGLQHDNPRGRLVLYRDTWRMASDRLLFGWGLGSYPRVFYLYNKQDSPIDHLPVFYFDAHSDWLQAVAEVGVVGTLLLAATILGPLAAAWRAGLRSRGLPELLAGCVLVLSLATVEFPFHNPAVGIAWLLCLFSAIRYGQLEHHAHE